MSFSEALEGVKKVFLDTAPIIYFIEAHQQFGPLVKQVVDLINENRIQAVTSVLTISEVLPKPVETGNEELAKKFMTYLRSGPNLDLITIGETISESAGKLRGKHPYLKTVDAIQISAALDAEADAFLTNDKKLSGIKEIRMILLSDYLPEKQP
jgi:predicted nucleic acid-binding protein